MATKHEDQADCSWHNYCPHSYHHPVRVPWIQMQVMADLRSIHSTAPIILLLQAKKTYGLLLFYLVCSGAVTVLECLRCRVCLMLDGDWVSGLKCRVFLDAMHV